ncbi:MAG TPA: T9SS type A sorting domain-containing protein, partial [Bacteroidota bacterium]
VQFAVTSGGTPPYQWSSTNPVVASINPSTGLLTALERGTTTVTVVDSLGFVGTSGTVTVNDVRVTLPDTAVWPLDSIDIPVIVDDLTGLGIYSFEMRILHDSTSVEFLSVIQSGTLSAPFSVFYQDTLDTLRIAGAGTAPLSGGGALLKLRFKASAGVLPPVTGPLEFTRCVFNEPGLSTPTALTQDGSLSVVAEAEVPVLASPPDGSTNIPFATSMVWNSSTGAAHYRIQISEDSTFATAILDSAGLADTSTSVSGLSPNTLYFWRVSAGNLGGSSVFSAAWRFTTMILVSVEDVTGLPDEFRLEQNFPNPFNPSTTIRFALPAESHVLLTVYDMVGNQIGIIFSGVRQAGTHQISYDSANLSSGVYFYQLEAVPVGRNSIPFQRTMKMVLMK